jgi:hypothetical protein
MNTIQSSTQRVVTFIIPIACRNFVSSWELACEYLRQTVGSILNSTDPRFAVVIVGHESPMEYLPKDSRLHFLRLSESTPKVEEKNLQLIARDWMEKMKLGREFAKQELPSVFVMRMDADDFLSNRVVGFLSRNYERAAFRISDGWVWNSGEKYFIEKTESFNLLCGSSIILSSQIADAEFQIDKILDEIPEITKIAKLGYSRSLLINEIHACTEKVMASMKEEILNLPFSGAIYRVGNINSVAQRTSKKFYSIRFLIGKIRRLRFLTTSLRKEFALY